MLLARSFNHVGPRQTPAYVAPAIARQIAAIERGELPPVLKMGNLDPERDVMDVRDTVRAYVAMMASAGPGVPYNVCGGRAIRIGDLVDLFRSRARVPVARRAGSREDAAERCAAPVRQPRAPDARETGWTPRIPLEQTVDDLLAWWRRTARSQARSRSRYVGAMLARGPRFVTTISSSAAVST